MGGYESSLINLAVNLGNYDAMTGRYNRAMGYCERIPSLVMAEIVDGWGPAPDGMDRMNVRGNFGPRDR